MVERQRDFFAASGQLEDLPVRVISNQVDLADAKRLCDAAPKAGSEWHKDFIFQDLMEVTANTLDT